MHALSLHAVHAPACPAHCSKMDAASRKFAELEKRETALGKREAAAEQADAAARERAAELDEREAAAGVRETSVAGALLPRLGLLCFFACSAGEIKTVAPHKHNGRRVQLPMWMHGLGPAG